MSISSEDILNAFYFRHACKEFDPDKKIADEDFQTILETGRLSPSSFGFEPWFFLIVQNRRLRERLKQFTWGGKKQIPTASHLLVILARKGYFMRYDSEYITSLMRNIQKLPDDVIGKKIDVYKKFQESDFKLLESERTLFDWASKQTYIALGNMMTSAAMLGIDSCPIEGFERDKIEQVLAEDFAIDTELFGISCMAAFGFRIKEGREKTRQPIENITRWCNH